MLKMIADLLQCTYTKWHRDHAPHIAAALTYYALLSLAPLLVVLVGVLGRFLGSATVTEGVSEQARTFAGPLGEQVVRELIAAAEPTSLGTLVSVIAIVIAMAGAMRLFGELRTVFDRIWDIPAEESPEGGPWMQVKWRIASWLKKNLAAFLMVVAVGVLLMASVALSTAIALAAEPVASVLPIGLGALSLADRALSLVLVTALFAIVYRYLPRTSIGWRDVMVGAAATSAVFLLGRLLLEVYFRYASPGSAYGAVGSIVALLIWANFSLQLVLFGAEFTSVWTHTHGSRASAKQPGER